MPLPPELQAALEQLARDPRYRSRADLQRAMDARMRAYNSTPQADLCDLSPEQVHQLLYGDWATTGALRLAGDLSLDEVGGSALFADARTILAYVRDAGPIKETTAKNLPRAAVAHLLPLLRTASGDDGRRSDFEPPPRNEGDLYWLPNLRQVLLFAGLLARRKGLRISARGRALVADERAGELFALLFHTLFRELDLRALHGIDGHPGLQHTVALSFFKLRSEAREWAAEEALAESCWLPSAKDTDFDRFGTGHDLRFYTFTFRVLEPLVQFGLLERRIVTGARQWVNRREYRVTPLFDRFLRFEGSVRLI